MVVSFGRLGDIFGRVKMYNFGYVVYTVASLVLTIDPLTAQTGALWLVIGRIFQGIGAAFLTANSAAILTDPFPPNQRGLALGISNVAGISGSFIGLILGGLLAAINWRLVFLVSVPFGIFGTIWSYLKLRDLGERHGARIDWGGNASFAAGLVLVMVAITYGIEPASGHEMGWTSLPVILLFSAGAACLAVFMLVEAGVENPMFSLPLFKIRPFAFGGTERKSGWGRILARSLPPGWRRRGAAGHPRRRAFESGCSRGKLRTGWKPAAARQPAPR
jgi:MFS family permease